MVSGHPASGQCRHRACLPSRNLLLHGLMCTNGCWSLLLECLTGHSCHAVFVSTATMTTLKSRWLTNTCLPGSLACRAAGAADSGCRSHRACSPGFSLGPRLQGRRHLEPALSGEADITRSPSTSQSEARGQAPRSGWVMTCPPSVVALGQAGREGCEQITRCPRGRNHPQSSSSSAISCLSRC